MWRNSFDDDSESEDEVIDIVYRQDTAKDLLAQLGGQEHDNQDEEPLSPALIQPSTQKEETPLSDSRSQSQPLFSSISSSAPRSIKLSTLQQNPSSITIEDHENSAHSIILDVESSDSEPEQPDIIDDQDDDFDEFFVEQNQKRKKPILSQSQPISSKNQLSSNEDIEDFSDEDEEEYFTFNHSRFDKPKPTLSIQNTISEINSQPPPKHNKSPFQSPKQKKQKVNSSSVFSTTPKKVTPSQFSSNYLIQSRLAEVQKITSKPSISKSTSPFINHHIHHETIDVDEIEDDVADFDDDQMKVDPQEKLAPTTNVNQNWLSNYRQNSTTLAPHNTHRSDQGATPNRHDLVKNIRAPSGTLQSRYKFAVANITNDFTFLQHGINNVKSTQNINTEHITVKIILEREEGHLLFTVCRMDDDSFVDVLFDQSTRTSLHLTVGRKYDIYKPWTEYQHDERRIITNTFFTLLNQEYKHDQLDVTDDLKQLKKIRVKTLLSESEKKKKGSKNTPKAQRKANAISSPSSNARKTLNFDSQQEEEEEERQHQNIRISNRVQQTCVTFNESMYESSFNQVCKFDACVYYIWSFESLLSHVSKTDLGVALKSKNTLLVRIKDRLAVIELPVGEFTYWKDVITNGIGRSFTFEWMKFMGTRFVKQKSGLFHILKHFNHHDHQIEMSQIDLFTCTIDVMLHPLDQIPSVSIPPLTSSQDRRRVSGTVLLMRDLRDTFSPHAFVVYLSNPDCPVDPIHTLFVKRSPHQCTDYIVALSVCVGHNISVDVSVRQSDQLLIVDQWSCLMFEPPTVTTVTCIDDMSALDRRKRLENLFDKVPTLLDMTTVSDGDSQSVVVCHEEFQLYGLGNVDGYLTSIDKDKAPKPFVMCCAHCSAPIEADRKMCRYCLSDKPQHTLLLNIHARMTDRIHLRVDHGAVERIFKPKQIKPMKKPTGSETFEQAEKVLIKDQKSKFLVFCYGVEVVDGVKHVYLEGAVPNKTNGRLKYVFEPLWSLM
ncbi:glycine cleavage system H protein [Acrasis kona]|uniref:Glycine cleavage system H protein n=1 Tax=Acrasis kona TaxID=1008807 RepID=A0AAW2Z4V4_9EUKA